MPTCTGKELEFVSVPLVVDTDPGVDDAFALALAAASPEVELLAVTTVFGNVELARTTDNALRLLTLLGRPEVPVGAGAERPLVYPVRQRAGNVHGVDGLGGQAGKLPAAAAGPDPRGAVGLLADVLRASPSPVVLAALGPLTNVALLLAVHPKLRERIGRLVVMGGAVAGGGNITATAEFNLWSDPEAARRVLLEEALPTTLVPIDLTHRCSVGQPWLTALAAGGGVAGEALAAIQEHYLRYYQQVLGRPEVVLHDAVALLEAVAPGSLGTVPLPLDLECSLGPARGAVVVDRRRAAPGRPVHVALEADADAVRAEILRRLVS